MHLPSRFWLRFTASVHPCCASTTVSGITSIDIARLRDQPSMPWPPRVRPRWPGEPVLCGLRPPARGRGVASTAVSLAIEWAFEVQGVGAVVAVVDERNVASRATALRAGFALDGPAEPWAYSESGVMLATSPSSPETSQVVRAISPWQLPVRQMASPTISKSRSSCWRCWKTLATS